MHSISHTFKILDEADSGQKRTKIMNIKKKLTGFIHLTHLSIRAASLSAS